ncbi:MAG: hypothetical protein DMG00_21160 [Acidobacteria bacterium]|nr:MAG: hypothetical protein DMG00_21160 [Acidobacteriota bacterium]
MMAVPAAELPDGSQWSYEVKWDGYRAQIVKNGRSVSLASRHLKDITTQFIAVAEAARRLDERRDRLRSIIGDSGVLLSDALPGTAGRQACRPALPSGCVAQPFRAARSDVNGWRARA